MIKRIIGIFILCIILSCASNPWLPQSSEKKQNIKDEVCKQIEDLAGKEYYFPESIVTTMDYVHGAMYSLNENNGKAVIIAHDGMRYAKLTFVLDGDEKVSKVNIQKYSKNIVEIFIKYKIPQNHWTRIIDQFNKKGHGLKAFDKEVFDLSYDFDKDDIATSMRDPIDLAASPRVRMSTIRIR